MRVSVLTPTCNRPWAMRLTERWMARQTLQPDEWIVVDGGQTPSAVTRGQRYFHRPSAPGAQNFALNLLEGLQHVTGDILVCWEDDDYYAPTHLETIVRQLLDAPGASIAGDDQQRYYNVQHRRWRIFQNRGASLCQTALRASVLPLFRRIATEQLGRQHYGIDAGLWQGTSKAAWALRRTNTVVGIKGLPGQAGLGIGHRPLYAAGWTLDPAGATLRAWIGADADVYLAPDRATSGSPQEKETRAWAH